MKPVWKSDRECFLGDRALPHVTTIVRASGIGPDFSAVPEATLKRACERGAQAHKATHYLGENDLEDTTIAPEIFDYVAQVDLFFRTSGFAPVRCEHRIFSERFEFCGRLDAVGFLMGWRTIVDYKFVATLHRESTAAQLGGYRVGWNEGNPGKPVEQLAALHVGRDFHRLIIIPVTECAAAWNKAFSKFRQEVAT